MLKADVDVKSVLDALDRTAKAGRNMTAFWKRQRGAVLADLRSHFAARSSPAGKWPRYSEAYRAKARERVRKARLDWGYARSQRKNKKLAPWKRKRLAKFSYTTMLGRIKSAWKQFRFFRDGLLAINVVPFGTAHDEGKVIGRGHSVWLPARPFAWLSDKVEQKVADRGARYLARIFDEGKA